MLNILYASTIILCFAGVAFSLLYIWLNTFSQIKDLESRNSNILTISKSSLALSLIFSFLECLLADTENVYSSITLGSKLYSIIAISWLVVSIGCSVSMMAVLVSKTKYREGTLKSLKPLFLISIVGFIVGLFMAWLLS